MASYRYERDIKPEDLIQETPPPLTPAQQRANWWHYHWYYVVLIAAALLAVGYFVWNRVTEVQPDYTVAVVSRTDPDTAFLSQLETRLEALAGDVNGDGKVKVTVKGIWLALDFETQDAALQRLMQSSEDKLNSDFICARAPCSSWTTPPPWSSGMAASRRWTAPTRRKETFCRWQTLLCRCKTPPLPMMCRAKALPSGTPLAA